MAFCKFEWSHEDQYRSNDGRGPLTARILCVSFDKVTMERFGPKGGRRTRFELPLKFFLSPRCGWKVSTLTGNKNDAQDIHDQRDYSGRPG